ncbi:MAG: DNA polymerase PolB2 inactivated [Candidatus Methanohalarchaeum thermophilum]|uniref:DNA-directed DNA polymerase n=1 Tax=Methanohalarchaeum thermophilum TaxID=1903181 RepID=A0A1Q6DS62_METT1|nr:MAG: DNA polymerase PolB2 inactivated [Candidatus Methanohalarchaeum thermophilum]
MKLFDVSTNIKDDEIVLWIKNKEGTKLKKKIFDFNPFFYVLTENPGEIKDIVASTNADRRTVKKKPWPGRPGREVQEIKVREFKDVWELSDLIYRKGDYSRHRVFNVDISIPHRFLIRNNLFPTINLSKKGETKEDRFKTNLKEDFVLKSIELTINPSLSVLNTESEIKSIKIDDIELKGKEKEIIEELEDYIADIDPDLIFTDKNNTLSYLFERAYPDFKLGREKGRKSFSEKSYRSYGRVVYKPSSYSLNGRIAINKNKSFIYRESGMKGILELSKLSKKPIHETVNASPGTIISSIQVLRAIKEDILIPWNKKKSEEFKSLEKLFKADRGGFTYQPRVGFHKNAVEVDFSSLYPNIIEKHNISPETINCRCCTNEEVPQLNYSICQKKTGFLPKVLKPILEKRKKIKDNIKTLKTERRDKKLIKKYKNIDRALKWILVTCFGYTGYKNAKYGKIEVHESICAYGRKILTKTAKIAEKNGFKVLHGIVDSIWIKGDGNLKKFKKQVEEQIGIPLEIENNYKWIVFLPRRNSKAGALNKYYGILEDESIVTKGIETERKNIPTIVKKMQKEILKELKQVENLREFKSKIPETKKILKKYQNKIKEEKYDIKELTIESTPSKKTGDYKCYNRNKAALKKYQKRGYSKNPGEKVKYIIRNSQAENENKVSIAEENPKRIDKEFYNKKLERAQKSLLLHLN